MGYYTRYRLDYEPKCLETSPSIELAKKTAWDSEYNPFEEPCKWYDNADDMKAFSLRFPDVLFILRGEGEEAGDIWVKYFKNGKMQFAQAVITIPSFDPLELR